MRHCVAGLADVAAAGASHFYTGTVGHRRVTVELSRRNDRWRSVQVRGRANSCPGRSELGLLQRWSHALQAKLRAPPTRVGADAASG